jgi:hypothetical protein
MNRLAIALLLALFPVASTRAGVPTLSFDEVRPGMTGTGRTVFEGTRVESFDVEILGKLPNIGPDQNLILARCSGGPLSETRVLSGMSGSPVTVDGKLIGAIAYSWGFSQEAIAGITPIDEMLAITRLAAAAPSARSVALMPGEDALARLDSAEELTRFFAGELTSVFDRGASAMPVTVPLAVSGLGAHGLARVLPHLAGAGLAPMQAGGSGGSVAPAPPLEPGSAVGLKLVRGDLEMTATGTATWVDGDQVLALGHPLFGLGAIDLPLTGANVEALLPSLQQSSRIATPLAEVGALRQDRTSGVYGLLGADPSMIPVRLQFSRVGGAETEYSFDIAEDPLLSPLLLYVSLNGILASRERVLGQTTVRLRQGSVIKMVDDEDVELDNLFSGPTAFEYGTGIPAYILYLLLNNAWSQPSIAGINLMLEFDDAPRTGSIRRAALDRYRVRAGETVQATVVLSPYRGRDRVLTSKIKIPEETAPGRLELQVGGALAVSRSDARDEPILPRDLGQLIRLINQLRRNDRIYIVATREDSGVLLGGTRLPNLPPSVAAILARPRSSGNLAVVPRRRVLEEVIDTDVAVAGTARLQLEVEAP